MGPLVPLVALLWLASAPATLAQDTLDPRTAAAVYEDGISKDLNPFTADSFLRDQRVLDWLRSGDPERQARLVTQATQLKDLSDMLAAYQSPATLVDALAVRLKDPGPGAEAPYFGFGQDTSKFARWNAHWRILGDNAVLRKALLEYDTLNPKPKDYLVSERVTEAAWQKTSFAGREAALKRWVQMVEDNINAVKPKTSADLETMRGALGEIGPLLEPAEKRRLSLRLQMAEQGVKGLAELDKHAAQLNSPELQALVRQARTGSVEDSLAALSRIFDKLGVPNKALQALRPTTAAERLTDSDREILGRLLESALLAQADGTDAGDDLTEFRKKHPMKIGVTDIGTDLAQFRPLAKDIVFNEKFIMDWVKGEGLKAHDLLANKTALDRLSMLLAPSFVHEARHQEQQAWAEEHGLKFLAGQNYEVEAKGVEALFFLQKSRDPAWRKFYDDNRDSSILARAEIQIAAELNQGAPHFRSTVMSDYYEGLPSLEAMTAQAMKDDEANVAFLRRELERRSRLPQPEQDALESSGKVYAKGQSFKTAEEWRAFAPGLKTSVLRRELDSELSRRDNLIESYRGNLQRAEDFQLQLDAGVKKFGEGKPGPAKAEPPPPRLP